MFVHVPMRMARYNFDYITKIVFGVTGAVRARMILQTHPDNRPRYSTVPTLNGPKCKPSVKVINLSDLSFMPLPDCETSVFPQQLEQQNCAPGQPELQWSQVIPASEHSTLQTLCQSKN